MITGGDSEQGRAVAIAYAREGADVLISYLSEDSDAKDNAGCREGRSTCRTDEGRRCRSAALPGHHPERGR